MDTNIRIQRYTYMHAYMSSYIKTSPPPLSHRQQTKGKMSFIHSFNPDICIAPLQVHYYSEALPTTVIDSVIITTPPRGLGGVVMIDAAIGAHGRGSRPAHYFTVAATLDKSLTSHCL